MPTKGEGKMGYVLYAEDGVEVVGISIWGAAEAYHRYRDPDRRGRDPCSAQRF
jgi:hypothetical protein